MRSNFVWEWKLAICVDGSAVSFVRLSSLYSSRSVSLFIDVDLIGDFFPSDAIYYLILNQRHKNIRSLQDRWPTVLVSTARYATEASAASELAKSLSGSQTTSPLLWLNPVVCELPSDNPPGSDSQETIVDAEPEDLGEITLLDHLESLGNVVEGSLNKDEDEQEPMKINLDWQIPMVRFTIFSRR